jgi:putative hydrolases of HD superfamily
MQQIIDFVLQLDALKSVTRKIKPRVLDRYENPAEHSWQIALLALALEPHAAQPVDINRVIQMLLVHDVGEIDTGDTMAFVTEGAAERKAGELAAVTRIFGLLDEPTASHLLALWHEFDEEATAEARFAHACDRAIPVLLNLANGGQSWVENGISHARVVARVGPQINAGSPALWAHVEAQLTAARDAGWFHAQA